MNAPRVMKWSLTVKFDCDLPGNFLDGFLNFVGSTSVNVDPDATFRRTHMLARFELPYRLFEFVAALRALESDHMRINTCHRRMPSLQTPDRGTQRGHAAGSPLRHRSRSGRPRIVYFEMHPAFRMNSAVPLELQGCGTLARWGTRARGAAPSAPLTYQFGSGDGDSGRLPCSATARHNRFSRLMASASQ
jgi:hypothetical protein